MTTRLILICHASTAAIRSSSFPADEPLDEQGKTSAAALAGRLPKADRCLTSPELRTRQTAEALGLGAVVEPTLRDCDFGFWSGRSFRDVYASEPVAIATWLHDPSSTPHGGESLLTLMQRIDEWLQGEHAHSRRSIVVTHSTIIRATIVHTLGAPAESFWRVDIAPLSITRLSGENDRWNLMSSGCKI